MISTATPARRPTPPAWVILVTVLVALPTLAFVAMAMLAAGIWIDGASADRTTHLSAPLADGGTVTIDATNAAVRVVTGPAATVTVDDHFTVRAVTHSLAERLAGAGGATEVSSDSDGVRVTVKPRPVAFANEWRDVLITIPSSASLVMRSANGAGDFRGLTGDVSITGENGAFRFREMTVARAVRVSTVNGAISVDGRMAGGSLDLSTVNGAVGIHVPRDTNAVYDLGTVNGRVNVSGEARVRQSGRAAAGRLGNGSEGTISAHTTDGGVSLVVSGA